VRLLVLEAAAAAEEADPLDRRAAARRFRRVGHADTIDRVLCHDGNLSA
jgi:hypothetical protein